MRKVHGLDVLKEIKTLYPKIHVIMVTGYKSVETASEAARLGASGYIVKPFKSNEIINSIKKLII
jgi:DNA-binding NtrC family response regulator